jgi:hypothetical protein
MRTTETRFQHLHHIFLGLSGSGSADFACKWLWIHALLKDEDSPLDFVGWTIQPLYVITLAQSTFMKKHCAALLAN